MNAPIRVGYVFKKLSTLCYFLQKLTHFPQEQESYILKIIKKMSPIVTPTPKYFGNLSL